MSANWKTVKEDLNWSLNTGEDVKGRVELRDSFTQGAERSMTTVVEAYKMGQRDGHKLANFTRCVQEDDNRLYNMGRKLIDLKSV